MNKSVFLQILQNIFLNGRKFYSVHYLDQEEEFEDTKGVIRIPKSKKHRQHSGQTKKDKQRSTKRNI